jgi:hypothetical protein
MKAWQDACGVFCLWAVVGLAGWFVGLQRAVSGKQMRMLLAFDVWRMVLQQLLFGACTYVRVSAMSAIGFPSAS